MADPRNLRLSDADDPDRDTKFTKALKISAANGNAVLRQLADAYIAFVDREGRSPVFPVKIISADAGRQKPRRGK